MNGFHLAYAAFVLVAGLCFGTLGYQYGAIWGCVAATTGATTAYLTLLLMSRKSAHRGLPMCECGSAEKSIYAPEDDRLWIVCECGRRMFIENGRMFRETETGAVVQIARRSWCGRWIRE